MIPFVATYRDAIEHLLDFSDAVSVEAAQTRVRSAIQSAYREISFKRPWRYLKTHGRLTLNAPYSTGTVTYASGTRTLTLSGGSWPTWARYGHISIAGYTPKFKVAEWSSATAITLEPDFCPDASITTATSYVLYRSTYTLPGDLVTLDEVHDEANLWSRGYVTADEWMSSERRYGGTQKPFAWTVIGSHDLYGALQIGMYGYPATAETLDFIYGRKGRPLRLDGYARYSSYYTNVVTDIDDATVTLKDAVEPDVLGAIFRASVAGATVEPQGENSINSYLWQRTIRDRPGTRTLTLYDSRPLGYTYGERFTISDPVDLPEYLYDAFLRNAEYLLLLKTDPNRAKLHRLEVNRAMEEAKARDSVVPSPCSPMDWVGFKHPAWQLLTGDITPSGGS